MTVIYVDTLFLLNAMIDYLLLLAAARLAGEPLARLRFFAAALLGGVYAVAIFLPSMLFLRHILCRISCCVLMLLIAYGSSRRLLRQGIIFLSLTFAFGGGVLAVSLLGQHGLALGNGVFYSPMDLKMVLLSGAICYMVLSVGMSGILRHTGVEGELVPVKLRMENQWTQFNALVDTGNTLTDPVQGSPVMVVEGEYIGDFLAKESGLTAHDIKDPVAALAQLERQGVQSRFRLIPYRAIGVNRGMLLGMKVDEALLNGKRVQNLLVALSPTPVSDGGGYHALVGRLD